MYRMADSVQYAESIVICSKPGKVCGTDVNSIENNDEENSISNECNQHPTEDTFSDTSRAMEESCTAQKVETNSLLGSYITKEYELLHLVLSHLPIGLGTQQQLVFVEIE
ncbi:hypothetical protein C0J52_19351 [Blattella germanica]|nr:hypothetical protein C0J52_19351 [Blattella germanica]